MVLRLENVGAGEFLLCFFEHFQLGFEAGNAFWTGQSNFNCEGGETLISVIVAEEEAMLGAGGEHAVGVFDTFSHEVVDHNADEAVVAGEDDFGLIGRKAGSVDSGDDALPGGFFVAGCSVDLPGEEESGEELGHEGRAELEGVGHVVFNGVAGTNHFDVFESGNGFEGGKLNVSGHGAAEPLDIYGLIVPHFLFEENWVRIFVGEADNFIFYGWAIARTDPFNLSAKHCGLVEVIAEDLVGLGVGVRLPSGEEFARFKSLIVEETHRPGFGFGGHDKGLFEI